MTKLWGGCFEENINKYFEKLNNSIDLDKRLWKSDLECSIGYAKALFITKLITTEELNLIIEALHKISNEWQNNNFILNASDEDIHTANERRLKELIGPQVGGKLHTGRSRNDQVSTDVKWFMRNQMYPHVKSNLSELIEALTLRAKEFANDDEFLIFPGYTHLQRAQPVSFSHWLLSHAWSFHRDYVKINAQLKDQSSDINTLTLGSGAIAGNPLPNFDRHALAKELGFTNVSRNSIDATSNRDFIVDALYYISLIGLHLSKLAEDLILYSTKEFGYLKLSDSFTTGSSLMPQKKNPDSLEIVRGKCAKFISNLNAMEIIIKGLPSTYNKDYQDDKGLLFDSYDTVVMLLHVVTGIVNTLNVDKIACQDALSIEMLSTDVAYYLVKKGVPFRDAHHLAGNLVCQSQKMGKSMNNFTLAELKCISDQFEADISDMWNYSSSVQQYQAVGGTAKENVIEQIQELINFVNQNQKP